MSDETQDPAGEQPAGGAPEATPSGQADDPVERSVREATAAVNEIADEATSSTPQHLDMPDFDDGARADETEIRLLDDVDLEVRIELGRTRMLVDDVLHLGPDSVVELDKAAGDPVDVFVNGRRVARGEVLVLNENFCVRVSEILDRSEVDPEVD